MDGLLYALTLAGVVGAGVNGGVFYAFSTFVMRGIDRAPTDAAIRAMQGINVEAPMARFMFAFLGTAVLCVVLAIWAITDLGADHGPWLLAGSLLYLVGNIGVTGGYNVPRNNRLDAMDPDAPDAEQQWKSYLREWVAGNHVRTITGMAAAAAFAVALSQ
jgi:uncharacterized membrane protein